MGGEHGVDMSGGICEDSVFEAHGIPGLRLASRKNVIKAFSSSNSQCVAGLREAAGSLCEPIGSSTLKDP